MPFGKNARMDDLKDKIRTFLKDMEMSRDVFAKLCGVSKSQVDKWLSYLPIPEPRQLVIERIMLEEYSRRRKSQHDPSMDILEIPFPRNHYDKAKKTAALHGMTFEEWASRSLVALSNIPRQ